MRLTCVLRQLCTEQLQKKRREEAVLTIDKDRMNKFLANPATQEAVTVYNSLHTRTYIPIHKFRDLTSVLNGCSHGCLCVYVACEWMDLR